MVVYKKAYLPSPSTSEILRYAGVRAADEQTRALLAECLEIFPRGPYELCYSVYPVTLTPPVCRIGEISVNSKDLCKALDGCDRAVLFTATLGAMADRAIMKYSRVSPAKAHMLDAIAAEMTECVCNAFWREIKEEAEKAGDIVLPRVSAGYGDIPLSLQRDTLTLLDLPKSIGVSLTESMLFTPTKTVSAVFGIGRK